MQQRKTGQPKDQNSKKPKSAIPIGDKGFGLPAELRNPATGKKPKIPVEERAKALRAARHPLDLAMWQRLLEGLYAKGYYEADPEIAEDQLVENEAATKGL
eukprot:jgi/Botrbrau1/22856/Bobra.0065s0014.1